MPRTGRGSGLAASPHCRLHGRAVTPALASLLSRAVILNAVKDPWLLFGLRNWRTSSLPTTRPELALSAPTKSRPPPQICTISAAKLPFGPNQSRSTVCGKQQINRLNCRENNGSDSVRPYISKNLQWTYLGKLRPRLARAFAFWAEKFFGPPNHNP